MVKKYFILGVLFVLPTMIYLFFATGINHFKKLPVLVGEVTDIVEVFPSMHKPLVSFKNKITVLGFLGNKIQDKKTNILILNEKIYSRFYKFNGFQLVMIVPIGTEKDVQKQVSNLKKFTGTDTYKWNFVYGSPKQINQIFDGLQTSNHLDRQIATNDVYIIDKEKSLRGRYDNKQKIFGYNSTSMAEISNTMLDDVKILLAEYRLALKKNKNLEIMH